LFRLAQGYLSEVHLLVAIVVVTHPTPYIHIRAAISISGREKDERDEGAGGHGMKKNSGVI
jgi:hypothetical protein